MKISSIFLTAAIILAAAPSLQAGEVIVYGATQNPGKLKFSSATEIPEQLLDGQWGGTIGVRLSPKRIFGYEQNISYSPRFAKEGVKAFQMDGNLVLQVPGNIAPYATAGVGFIVSWGKEIQENSVPEEIAAAAFSFGADFTYNYGGGIKFRRIAGPLGFNFDLREYTVPHARDGSLNFIQVGFGAVITW